MNYIDTLKNYKLVFFDFDGVIKESVDVKTQAFKSLFKNYGNDLKNRIEEHHLSNGGISRYLKIPIYLEWAGIEVNQNIIDKYAYNFSNLVVDAVVNSNWVKGALEYLQTNKERQRFILITATPDKEIDLILSKLKIKKYFCDVFGSSVNKKKAISISLNKYQIANKNSVMIGDSSTDMEAAIGNSVDFILRSASYNKSLQKVFNGPHIKDFNNE